MFEQLRWLARIGLITTRMLNRGGGLEALIEMEKSALRGVEELFTASVVRFAVFCRTRRSTDNAGRA